MLLLAILLAAILHVLHLVVLYAIAFVVDILTVLFDVAYQSFLPALVGREQLIEGNSKLAVSRSAALISGALGSMIGLRPTLIVGAIGQIFTFL